jgi:hypothetical protein
LLALAIPVTNVTLRIDPGYPFGGGFKPELDLRDDKRVAEAVERLFGKTNR